MNVVLDDIYTRAPADGKAASVVGQSGCEDELTNEQKMDNLRAKVAGLQDRLQGLPKIKANHVERKRLGKEIADINLQINSLKDHDTKTDLTHYILDVVKENMTPFQWKKTISEARQRAEASDG